MNQSFAVGTEGVALVDCGEGSVESEGKSFDLLVHTAPTPNFSSALSKLLSWDHFFCVL